MTPEDNTSGNFGKPFWRFSLFCTALKKCLLRFVCEPESQKQSLKSHIWLASYRFPTAAVCTAKTMHCLGIWKVERGKDQQWQLQKQKENYIVDEFLMLLECKRIMKWNTN